MLTTSDLKHGNDPDSKFDKTQLKAGTKVEKEHSNNPSVAKSIAKAHLSEFKDYYKELDVMETYLKKKKSEKEDEEKS